jgi:hypothetical protein
LIVLGGLVVAGMGTFYWSWWEIPSWVPFISQEQKENPSGSSVDWTDYDDDTAVNPFGSNRPQPPQCIKDTVRARPKKRYCEWNTTLKECYEMLMSALHEQPSWIFLGDNGMANLPYYISLKWPFDAFNVTTRRHSCQNLPYYGLPPPKHGWIAPDPLKGEGPIGHGKENPYCMDCKKCWNILMDNPTTPDKYVEYLVLEYARDVSIPTLVTNTTQETAIYYLSTKSPAVCIASAGLHDAAIDPPISVDTYVQNVDKYLSLLQRTCKQVVWIGNHAVVENEGIPQKNCKLQKWNNAVLGLVEMRDYKNVYVIDVWEKSLETDHLGSLELEKKFYASFARLFVTLMAGPDMIIG